jgi:hypothetical protein
MRPLRTKACKQCGCWFTYEAGRGLDRTHCSKLCQGRWHRKNKTLRAGNCKIQNCTRKATRPDELCETHWYRRYRTGSVVDRQYKEFHLTSNGYYTAFQKGGHPIARKDGMLLLHRMVLWDSIGDGSHKCHWCKCEVAWAIRTGQVALHVDHVDGDKTNNNLSNLVPSCLKCNTSRGLFMKWAALHKDDPFLLSLFHQATSKAA